LQVRWIQEDGYSASGVCCGLTLPGIASTASFLPPNPQDPYPAWYARDGWIPWTAQGTFLALEGDADFPLYTVLVFVALAQVLLFGLGWDLGGAGAGLLAAALFPLLPFVAFTTRRWDVHAPEYAIVIAAAWALV